MKNNKTNLPPVNPRNAYGDGDIPDVDLPNGKDAVKPTEPLPESSRPRRDGPGGE